MGESFAGYIERITFHNEENGYTIARLKVPGRREPITLVGPMMGIAEGENLKVEGEWVHHTQYGRQLKVERYDQVYPSTLEGIRRYLGSGLIKGIGAVSARRIVERFGEQTLDIIEAEPQRLLEVPKLGRKRAELIVEAWAEQRQIKDVMVFLQSHGVSTGYAVKIYKEYGREAIERVRKNPYRLERDIFGIGFRLADRIARNLGFGVDSSERVQAGVRYLLNQAAEEGHVYLPMVDLMEKGKELLGVSVELFPPALETLRRDDGIVTEDAHYYLPPLYHAEVGVASSLRRLQRAQGEELEQPALERGDGLVLGEDQRRAVSLAAAEKVLVLTGGPGTGKTTVTREILALFEHNGLEVALCSPTGRAAKRLAEATGRPAKTIHRLLEFAPAERRFKKDYEDKLEVDALIVDEASMIDVVLMNALLRALPARVRLVVVGDVDQLPPVGPGNVLCDLIDSAQVPVVRLREIFRQARASHIVLNAHRINQGEELLLDHRQGADFFFVEEDDPERVVALIEELCARRLPAYGCFDARRDIQVIAPMYRGATGAHNLNRRLQQRLNPHGRGQRLGETEYRIGDRVMQIKNNYDKGVFNGDMGLVRRLDPEEELLVVEFDSPVQYDFAQLDELTLAYAISAHRAQGSEFPVVVMPLTMQHYIMLQRNLLYTAITRARRMMVLVGARRALERAIANNEVAERHTTLAQRLRGEVGEKLEAPPGGDGRSDPRRIS